MKKFVLISAIVLVFAGIVSPLRANAAVSDLPVQFTSDPQFMGLLKDMRDKVVADRTVDSEEKVKAASQAAQAFYVYQEKKYGDVKVVDWEYSDSNRTLKLRYYPNGLSNQSGAINIDTGYDEPIVASSPSTTSAPPAASNPSGSNAAVLPGSNPSGASNPNPATVSPTLPNPTAKSSQNPEDKDFQLIPCDGVQKQIQGENGKMVDDPNSVECDYGQVMVLLNRILNFLLYLSIPLVLVMIMYTAYTYLTANGDPGKIASAKKMLIPVALGIFWVLAGFIVVRTFLDSFLADNVGGADKKSFINRFLGK